MDRIIKTFFYPPDLCLFLGDVIGSSEINSHQTGQKPVKNLYKTYAEWSLLNAQDCNIQRKLTAMHGALHDFMDTKQEFEQLRTINKYINKMA